MARRHAIPTFVTHTTFLFQLIRALRLRTADYYCKTGVPPGRIHNYSMVKKFSQHSRYDCYRRLRKVRDGGISSRFDRIKYGVSKKKKKMFDTPARIAHLFSSLRFIIEKVIYFAQIKNIKIKLMLILKYK